MALELFKPFVIRQLVERQIAPNVKSAKRIIERGREEIWGILEEIIKDHPVMLNRAPTLHRLGIQAFEPVLMEGKAIRLHPMVCTAFNADFDGDQMAVHVPLSLEAQMEARTLMLASNNVLSPSNGAPIIVPSQDIVLGLYYATRERINAKGEGMTFSDLAEMERALAVGVVELHSKISVRLPPYLFESGADEDEWSGKLVRAETTVGRALLSKILPRGLHFKHIDKPLKKKEISKLIDESFRRCGLRETVIFADKLMQNGYALATRAGISFCSDDMQTPPQKQEIIAAAEAEVKEIEQQYTNGLVTQGERYNKVVDIWGRTGDEVAKAMMARLSKEKVIDRHGQEVEQDSFNSIFMMADSGARGSAAQIRQLAGMRGLMAKPDGSIIETPITTNFREGLNVLQYFISTHGARKGLADTALKTANSGYLTRRLVDVTQDLVITEDDCGTHNGYTVRALVEGGEVIEPLRERILGRVVADDLVDPSSQETVIFAGTLLTEDIVERIDLLGIDEVKVRTPLTCDTRYGLCAKCYGRDLGRGYLVNVGEAVGVIAAQSIGEPGTQLTMRTFHIGGAAARRAEQSRVEARFAGQLKYINLVTVESSEGYRVVMNRNGEVAIIGEGGRERERYKINYGAHLLAADNETVNVGDVVAQWDPYTSPILTDVDGQVKFGDIIENVTMQERKDPVTGLSTKVTVEAKKADLRPRISIKEVNSGETARLSGGRGEARYMLPMGAIIMVSEGDAVKAGDVLARIPRETTKTKDITGGLPRVAELFEVRKPKECAVISEVDGVISFGKQLKGKRKIVVDPGLGEEAQKEYVIPKGKHVTVHEGDFVRAGEPLMDGSINPHDILRSRNIKDLARYLVDEVQEVYRLQGVKINDKHIEVIVRQMLQRVRITYPGDSTFLIGEQVERWRFEEENARLEQNGENPAQAEPLLLGITKASLSTESFISAASFQETTKVLTEASIAGKLDKLKGLKENVIMGRLIPAGTGMYKYRNLEIPDTEYLQPPDLDHKYSDEDVNDAILEDMGEAGVEGGLLTEVDELGEDALL
jgi:DNA-directed RNA polymerase subunit beta'